jgi:serine/threonine protein kinase
MAGRWSCLVNTTLAREQSLFEEALPIADAAEREAFLQEACAGDAGLRARIAKLLDAHDHSDRFFSECVPDLAKAEGFSLAADSIGAGKIAVEMAGTRVGRYKLLRQLGEGGCGVVYLAEQQEPVRRRVALKVIKLGMDTKSVVARFEAERQALALMDHPNIAKVLDGGATEAGRPYFVMELVQGVKITTYCDEHHLDSRQRLDLFIQVCQAIQHAHQKGVIHRDIKPSNIQVTLNDGVAVPKVIDFGIAKAIEGRLTEDTAFTLAGQFVGTPAYMSPEQAQMSGLDVDTRSDIYSLGVLLYELLTGRTPFDQATLVRSGLDEMRRTLREDEPQRPSTLLTLLGNTDLTVTASCRQIEPPKLIKSLKGDLDWIVMKALEKDRRRRYETPNALAMDIQRYLNDEPVIARPPSRFYRLRKLILRNKVVYACGTIVAITLIAGLGISTRLYLKEREVRFEAERARANEMQLRQEAETREKVTQAAVLLSHGATEEADALVDPIPLALFSPSTEAAGVFHTLGEWNMLQAKWKKAAARYAVLVQVNQVDKADQTASATVDLLRAGPLLIEAGDVASYERIRRMELNRLDGTTNPNAAEQLIKVSLLLPADESLIKLIEPLARVTSDSLRNYEPKLNDGYFLAAWRAFALALFEYRRGNFEGTLERLTQCSGYADQSPSCVASVHILRGMTYRQLGEVAPANSEIKAGRDMVENHFRGKIELGDNKTGRLEGWLMAPIFLHEADGLPAAFPATMP